MLWKVAHLVQKLTGSVLGSTAAAMVAGNILLCIAILVFGTDIVLNNIAVRA